MKNFRLYMAVGGMPQALKAYIETNNLIEVDKVKRDILSLYKNDFYKIDPSGKLANIFENIPSQLALHKNRFVLSFALNKKTTRNDETMLSKLIDSKTILISYDCKDPFSSLYQTIGLSKYKLYLSDTGLFVSMLYNNKQAKLVDIYDRLLNNSIPENLGFLFENAVAQCLASNDNKLLYHNFYIKGHNRPYEIDFLYSNNEGQIIPIEVKSNSIKNYKSLNVFVSIHKDKIKQAYILSQKDIKTLDSINFYPFYLMNLLLK